MRKQLLFVSFIAMLMFITTNLSAQVGINNDNSQPDPSAGLDVKFNNKGMLVPRMTQSQIALITSPANGLIVFCTTDNKFYAFVATDNMWKEILYGPNTIAPIILPSVTTTIATNIAQTIATSGGNVTFDGGSAVTARGVCWSRSGNPTTADNHTSDGSSTGVFVSSLNGLTAITLYYVRSYATNILGTAYGDQVSFTTLANFPTVITSAITNITQTTATSGGNITDDGGASVIARGICWSTNANPTTADNITTDGIGTGAFVSSLSGLIGNTPYYIRAYATNSVGTSYGNQQTFTTSPLLATVSTSAVTGITQTTATSGGNVSSDGGATITARGVCWGTSSNPTTADSTTTDGSGTGAFVSTLMGLTGNTPYYVRAYAINIVGTSYGNQQTFTTSPVLATVATTGITNITQTTATSGGNVTSDGGAAVTARGVCWSINPNPTTANSITTDGIGTGSFVSSLAGLTGNTFYYVRSYATNNVGTAYGNQQNFTTSPLPATLTTIATTNITQTTATSGGNVTSDGGAAVTTRGVCWNTIGSPTTADNITTSGAGTGTFVSSLTGLTGNTMYYIRAYATNSAGTSYGNQQTFTSSPVLGILTTTAVTNITFTTATSGGNVTSDGGASVTALGVCWSTGSNPTTTNSHTTDGSGTGSFVSNLIGLIANHIYYVRAYATNSVGTAYGNQVSFSTIANLPTVYTSAMSNITQSTATSGGTVASDGGGTLTARGVCWSTSDFPTLVDSHTTDGTGTGSFVSNLIGLTTSTLYFVRAYSTNGGGTSYGNQVTFSTFQIGQRYQGGTIFYIDATNSHGLIADTIDQSTGAPWGCYGITIGGTGTAIGTGQANTAAIVNGCSELGIAARICYDLVLNGYSDWFLPSSQELLQMCGQGVILHMKYNDCIYWSSSEGIPNAAWFDAYIYSWYCVLGADEPKNHLHYVRACRAF